jgi:hypothetical protein
VRFRSGVAAIAAAGALLLSGCTVHPGSAAVVNGQSISESRIDDLVLAACNFSERLREQSGGTSATTSMAYLRTFLLNDLINFRISNEAAAQLGLTVSPAKIASVTGSEQIPPGLSSKDHDLMEQYFRDAALSQIQLAVIGAHLKDPSVTDADKVTQSDQTPAAKAWLARFTAKQDVSINPAYGTWDGQKLVDGQGSLSAPASGDAKHWMSLRAAAGNSVEGLPPSQVCG